MGNGLAERFPAGVEMSVEALSAVMIEESDNTACDTLLRLLGGPSVVNAMLAELGILGMRVDRAELDLGRDIDREGAGFSKDPRDQTTPVAMADLLTRIVGGKVASPASTQTLVSWLTATRTGAARLKAGLPAGASLLHKTGTYGDAAGSNATNDVGIITLADGARVVLVVYLKDAHAPLVDRERTLADVARAVVVGGT
jgi:beta-lactamase class A